jgi:hypothetical protein
MTAKKPVLAAPEVPLDDVVDVRGFTALRSEFIAKISDLLTTQLGVKITRIDDKAYNVTYDKASDPRQNRRAKTPTGPDSSKPGK